MPCEDFQNEIAEAAAAGTPPGQRLRSHMDCCDKCCQAFVAEKTLYESIDTGVRAVVNTDVPASLLPNVRVRLREASGAKPHWSFSWPTVAGATIAVCGVVLAANVWHFKPPIKAGEPAAIASAPATAASTYHERLRSQDEVVVHSSRTSQKLNKIPGATHRQSSIDGNPTTEVLVPKDQEMLLVSYTREMRGRKSIVVAERNRGTPEVAPIQVDLIQIAELDVKPLADEFTK